MTGTEHLPTEWLTELVAAALHGASLAPQSEAFPQVVAAEPVAGNVISLTIDSWGPLDDGAPRRREHRELRLSAVLIPDPPPAELDAEPVPVHDGEVIGS